MILPSGSCTFCLEISRKGLALKTTSLSMTRHLRESSDMTMGFERKNDLGRFSRPPLVEPLHAALVEASNDPGHGVIPRRWAGAPPQIGFQPMLCQVFEAVLLPETTTDTFHIGEVERVVLRKAELLEIAVQGVVPHEAFGAPDVFSRRSKFHQVGAAKDACMKSRALHALLDRGE